MRNSNLNTDRIPLFPVEDQEVKNSGIWLNSENEFFKFGGKQGYKQDN